MDVFQKKYVAFMESECKKHNCMAALPALKEGFKTFCEAATGFDKMHEIDYDPFDIDAQVALASDDEIGSENNDDGYSVERYTGQGIDQFDSIEETHDFEFNSTLPAIVRGIKRVLPKSIKVSLDYKDLESSTQYIRLDLDYKGKHYYLGEITLNGDSTITVLSPHLTDRGVDSVYGTAFKRYSGEKTTRISLDDPDLTTKIRDIFVSYANAVEQQYDSEYMKSREPAMRETLRRGAGLNDADFVKALHNGWLNN